MREPKPYISFEFVRCPPSWDVALDLFKRHSGILWGPGRYAGLLRRWIGGGEQNKKGCRDCGLLEGVKKRKKASGCLGWFKSALNEMFAASILTWDRRATLQTRQTLVSAAIAGF